ncbi:MAG: hypothetical protein Q9170_006384 [Blastenia crenularia]
MGDNLPHRSTDQDHDVLLASARVKRRKLNPQHNSQNTPEILDDSEGEDQLMTDDIVGIRHVTTVSKDSVPIEPKPSVSRESAKATDHWTTGISEYKVVEKLAQSSLPNIKKQRDREKRRARENSRTPRLSFASSHSDSIELLDNEGLREAPAKAPYRGTANLHPPRASHALEKKDLRRRTGDRSPHFPIPTAAETIEDPKRATTTVMVEMTSTDAKLRDMYRDTKGRRRSGVDQSSSDELVTGGSNSRALSPVKTVRSQTPVTNDQRHSPGFALEEAFSIDEQAVLNNIRPATFTGMVNQETSAGSRPHHNNYLGETPPAWNVPLYAYYHQGKINTDAGLGLVYNDKDKSFDVYRDGVNLAKMYAELRIQPRKLRKILFALEGKKIRCESSKIGVLDNVLDIELSHEKDVQELTAKIQEFNSMLVKGESETTLSKKFEHRLQEYRKAKPSGRTLSSKQPEDIALAEARVNRADAKRASEGQNQSKSKRRRLVDGLSAYEQSETTSRIRNARPTETSRNMAKKATVEIDRLGKSDDVNLEPLDDSLKRALRSHDRGQPSVNGPQEDLLDSLKENVQRYSRIHGLGNRWIKPLVYPKEGKKRTTVEWDDLERLDEGEFLNDNLIAFYLRYLESRAEKRDPTISKKVYMFNTFFYERLTSSNPGHKGINYDAVRKWTRGIDLFTYDFVVVPVHESIHWYVAIICNLPALSRNFGDEDVDPGHGLASASQRESGRRIDDSHILSSSPEGEVDDINEHETTASFAEMSLEPKNAVAGEKYGSPHIPDASKSIDGGQERLDFQLGCSEPNGSLEEDSKGNGNGEIGNSTALVIKKGKRKSDPPLRKYNPYKPAILTFDSFGTPHSATVRILKQYLHEEAGDKRGQMEFDEKELQGMTVKQIPLQSNFYDCGLYLLGYIEKFLEDPRALISKVMKRELHVATDWPKLDPSKMRSSIRKLIMSLHDDQKRAANEARRLKNASKSQNGPGKAPLSEGNAKVLDPIQTDGASEPMPKTPVEDKQRPLLLTQPTVDVPQKAEEPSHVEIPPPSSATATADKECVIEVPLKTDEADLPEKAPPPSVVASADKESAVEVPEKVEEASSQEIPSAATAIIKTAVEDPQKTDEESLLEIHPPSSATPTTDKQAATEVQPPQTSSNKQVPESFIVLDSQSQPANTTTPVPDTDFSESLALSTTFASTIPDSQPQVEDKPVEEKVREPVTHPRAKKPARRIDSFSSPPTVPKSSSSKRSSPRHTKTVITGTNPKVVICID